MGKVVSGVMWSTVERFSVQGIQLVLSMVIARLLLPSDYGLVAMLSVFLNISQVFVDSGFSKALIQKQNRTNEDCSTVFYFNIAVSSSIYLLLFIYSPLIASFYNEPQLSQILRVSALNLIITSLSLFNIHSLDYKRYAKITLASVLISGTCGLAMAYNGFGVWSLVFQTMLNNTMICILLWASSKWCPSLVFSKQSFKELFGFGSKLLASSLLTSIYANLYTLFIGKVFSSKELGLYNRSMTIVNMPSSNISEIITRVTYPVECELQNEDDKLIEKFFGFIRMTCFIVFPLMIGVLVLAEPFIRVVLTAKWIEAVPIIQILCIAFMFQPLMAMNWQLLNVKHRSDLALKSEIIKKLIAISILLFSLQFGLLAMCWGLAFYSLVDMVVITIFTKKILPKVTITKEIYLLLPVFAISIVSGLAVYAINHFLIASYMLRLFVGALLGGVIYTALAYIFRFKELSLIRSFIKK